MASFYVLAIQSSSNINSTFLAVWYVSVLRLAVFACVYSARKRIIFNFNFQLSFQQLCRLLLRSLY